MKHLNGTAIQVLIIKPYSTNDIEGSVEDGLREDVTK